MMTLPSKILCNTIIVQRFEIATQAKTVNKAASIMGPFVQTLA
jgi:hypothetical protein